MASLSARGSFIEHGYSIAASISARVIIKLEAGPTCGLLARVEIDAAHGRADGLQVRQSGLLAETPYFDARRELGEAGELGAERPRLPTEPRSFSIV